MQFHEQEQEDIEEIYAQVAAKYGAQITAEQRKAAEPPPAIEPEELLRMNLICYESLHEEQQLDIDILFQLLQKEPPKEEREDDVRKKREQR